MPRTGRQCTKDLKTLPHGHAQGTARVRGTTMEPMRAPGARKICSCLAARLALPPAVRPTRNEAATKRQRRDKIRYGKRCCNRRCRALSAHGERYAGKCNANVLPHGRMGSRKRRSPGTASVILENATRTVQSARGVPLVLASRARCKQGRKIWERDKA